MKNNIILLRLINFVGDILIPSILLFYSVEGLEKFLKADNMAYINIGVSQASLGIAMLVFWLKKSNIKSKINITISIVFFAFATLYCIQVLHSPDLLKANIQYAVAQYIVLLIIVDIVVFKNIPSFDQYNKMVLFGYIIVSFLLLYHRMENTSILLFLLPTGLFFTIDFTNKKWNDFLAAFCLSWVFLFSKTIISGIHQNSVSFSERWFGPYPILAMFGYFLNCCFCVAMFLFLFSLREYGVKSVRFLFSVIGVLVAVAAVCMAGTRTSFLGIGCVALVSALLFRKDISREKTLFRLRILGSFIILILLVCIALAFVPKTVMFDACKYVDDRWGESTLGYLLAHFLGAYATEIYHESADQTVLFRIMDALDTFTARRITIYKEYIKCCNFIGNGSAIIEIGEFIPYHAHNTYIQMMYQYGIVTGIVYVFFYIMVYIKQIKSYILNKDNRLILPIIWLTMMLSVWFPDTMVACSTSAVMGIFLSVTLFLKDIVNIK